MSYMIFESQKDSLNIEAVCGRDEIMEEVFCDHMEL